MFVVHFTAGLLGLVFLFHSANGHGHMMSPRSRNYVAGQDGTWGEEAGVLPRESCPHCLNQKAAEDLCGVGNAGSYDANLDSTGVPMPWTSQETLQVGQEFNVISHLDTNHAGHVELYLCKAGENNPAPTQECLWDHPLEYVRDLTGYDIPKDENYPVRGYLADVGLKEFHFVYKIPEGIGDIEGDKVLMQWRYITANSCQPPGYKNSTIGSWLDEKGWLRSGGNLYDCKDVHLYDRAGNRDEDTPEQFWNCAEITVLAAGPVAPMTPSPDTPPISVPVSAPVSAPSPPSPSPPSSQQGTTTRYWDCSGGACGCAYLTKENDNTTPAHCYSNAMFDAPTNNPHNAKYYGTAAVSPTLFNAEDTNVEWRGSGCGKCWKVTGTANVSGYSHTTTLVLKGANLCPSENEEFCGDGKAHFDIAAPGFDVEAYSFSHTCGTREPAEIDGFQACSSWMIDSQNPSENCMCSKFSNPILRAGCENFLFLKWDNSLVSYEEVQCPFELDRLSCWEENGDSYPPFGTIPEYCAANLDDGSNPPPPSPSPPSPNPSPGREPYCRYGSDGTKFTAACDGMTGFGNSYFAGSWCGISKGSCEACNGLWCAPTSSPTMDPVPTSSPTAAIPSARPSLRGTTSPTTSSVNNPTQAPVSVPVPSAYCNWQGCNGVVEGGDWCNANIDRCTNGCGGTWCGGTPTDPPVSHSSNASGYCNWQGCNGVVEGDVWCNRDIDKCTNGCGGTWCTN